MSINQNEQEINQKLTSLKTKLVNNLKLKGVASPDEASLNTLADEILQVPNAKPEQEKTVNPTASELVIVPDEGFALSSVLVKGDNGLIPENIKAGASIFNVSGSYTGIDLPPLSNPIQYNARQTNFNNALKPTLAAFGAGNPDPAPNAISVLSIKSFNFGITLKDGSTLLLRIDKTLTSYRFYPSTNSFVAEPELDSAGYIYGTGTLLDDGTVFLMPYEAGSANIYNPETKELRIPSGSSQTFESYAYACCVKQQDGNVFLPPLSTTNAILYNPKTETFEEISAVKNPDKTKAFCFTAQLLFDNTILILPSNKAVCPYALRYYPATKTVEAITALAGVDAYSYAQSKIFDDGAVFCQVLNSNLYRHKLYYPSTNTAVDVSGIPLSANNLPYGSIAITFNRCIIFAPRNAPYALEYNYSTDTSRNLALVGSGVQNQNQYIGITTLSNTSVLFSGYSVQSCKQYFPNYEHKPSLATLISGYYNSENSR